MFLYKYIIFRFRSSNECIEWEKKLPYFKFISFLKSWATWFGEFDDTALLQNFYMESSMWYLFEKMLPHCEVYR